MATRVSHVSFSTIGGVKYMKTLGPAEEFALWFIYEEVRPEGGTTSVKFNWKFWQDITVTFKRKVSQHGHFNVELLLLKETVEKIEFDLNRFQAAVEVCGIMYAEAEFIAEQGREFFYYDIYKYFYE